MPRGWILRSLNIVLVLFITASISYAQDAQEVFNQGKEYYNKQMYDEAIKEFTKVIVITHNDCPETYVYRGRAYAKKNEFAQAVSDYSLAIKIKRDYTKAYVYRGRAYGAMGDYKKALFDYEQAIRIDPHNAEAFYNRAKTFFSAKEYDKSWEDVNKAEALGYKLEEDFIEELKKASEREK